MGRSESLLLLIISMRGLIDQKGVDVVGILGRRTPSATTGVASMPR
jgi:hypothetical protein